MTVSVHNPATGQDIPYTWTIAGGTSLIAIEQIAKNQGMVAWRVKDLATNKYKMVWGVYNPGWAALQGRPEVGWMFTETWVWIDNDTNIVALNDGVFVYETKYTDTGGQTHISVGVYTFDPSGWNDDMSHGWMPYGWRGASYSISNWSGVVPRDYTVKDGVTAFIYDGIFGGEVNYAVYDPRLDSYGWRIGWQLDDTYNATNATNLQITNGTVTWTDNSGDQKRGYDYSSGSWISGVNTKVLAYFDFWPTPAKPGQWVYFTDMSIAATNWYYAQGDGGTTGARSFYHKYAKAGQFQVLQNVSGPAGADSLTRTVAVNAPADTGPLMLLLD